MIFRIGATMISQNAKLGGMAASWSGKNTCPPTCELLNPLPGKKAPPCYFWGGYRTRQQGERLAQQPDKYFDPEAYAAWLMSLPRGYVVRDRVGGDQIPEQYNPDNIDAKQFGRVKQAARRRKLAIFGFTKYNLYDDHNRALVLSGYRSGFVLNASAGNLWQAIELKQTFPALGVTCVVPSNWDRKVYEHTTGERVVTCPNHWDKSITCARCMLCAKPSREVIVAFPAHGTAKKSADLISAIQL